MTTLAKLEAKKILHADLSNISKSSGLYFKFQITDYLYVSNITAISKGDMLFYFLQT